MKTRLFTAAFSAFIALTTALAGCSGAQTANPAETSKQAANTATANTNTNPQQNVPVNSGTKQLIVGRGGDSVSIDPILVSDNESFRITENIFEQLVNYEETSTKVVPGLAESWNISPDGLSYSFKLRQGVKFHDGTDFNAEAVVFNFDRWMDKNNPLHSGGGFEYYNDLFGGFKGDKDHIIASIKAIDPYTVEFKLNRPSAPFISNLGVDALGIASPAALKKFGEKFGESPVGTGPFKFVEWKRNESITLEKNQNYWNNGFPKLDKLVFKVIPENTARLTALTTGEIDFMDGLNPDDVQTVKENKDLQLILRHPINIAYLGFNVEKKPFDNPKVRQAIAYLINKPQIIQSFYNGLAEPAKNPFPSSIFAFNDDIKDREYNVEKAKKLLTEAGYPNGFKTTIWAPSIPRPYMPEGKKIAEALQQEMKKIGIETQIVALEWATQLKKIHAGEQDMFLFGWNGDIGDPDNFLYVLLDKNNIGGNNNTRYSNEEVHKLLLQAQSELNQAKRTELYKKAQELIFNDVPMIPLVHTTPPIVAKTTVTGYIPHPKSSEPYDKIDIQ